MARAIEVIERPGKPALTVGHFNLDLKTDDDIGWQHAAHDGDTANTLAVGYLPVRFLGMDTPEVAFSLPEKDGTRPRPKPIDDAGWQAFLADPFGPQYPPFQPELAKHLEAHLRGRLKKTAALNHAKYAKVAREELVKLIKADMAHLGANPTQFLLFHAFAYEALDRYGRLLAYVHPDQPPGPQRLPSYNDRLLTAGLASPYFIWPNVDPFLTAPTWLEAVIPPRQARDYAEAPGKLRAARESVRNARARGQGLFDLTDPLQLYPFELRFLADRRPPARWVIDLSRRDDLLIEPQAYYEIANIEDRLYISPEHVGFFEAAGWRKRASDRAVTSPGTKEVEDVE